MTENTKKSFASIRDDYAFFEAHTTEFDQDLCHYQSTISQWIPPEEPLKFLDFGCGTGVFTSRFLKLLNPAIQKLEITLVEPDETYRQQAVNLLANYTPSPINNVPHTTPDISTRFHLILSNHVLYYVPDLRQTVAWLLQRRHPQGMMLISMAGKDNLISQFWRTYFDSIEQKLPYHLAQDLIAILHDLHPTYQRQTVTYELRFPDTTENRWKLLRFMLGQHLKQYTNNNLIAWFDPYVTQGQVNITTSHDQFII